MAKATVAIFVLVLATAPASGSFIEDTLAPTGAGLHYQEDGGQAGDAPEACEDVEADRQVVLDDPATSGMLVDIDDESDVYALSLEATSVGERVAVQVLERLLSERYDVSLDILAPGCGSSVLDADSEYYDPAPEQPYEPGAGAAAFEGRTTAPTADSGSCDPNGWKFLANQMHGTPAPSTIYVQWTDGSYEYVPVTKSTPATVAQYRTSSNLETTVARMVIVLPVTWSGNFHIASGPCDAVQGVPQAPPEQTPTYGEFTVQESGLHVVHVYISRGTVDKTADTANDLVNDPPTSFPISCHRDVCQLAMAEGSYDLGSATKEQTS